MADISYTVKIDNYDQLEKLFKRAPAKATAEIHTAIQHSLVTLQNAIMREAPVNKSASVTGGDLKQSITAQMTGTASGEVRISAPYAGYVEGGTRPHDIRPVNKKVLADRRAGNIFGKLVHHPGTTANPFVQRGIDKANPQIQTYFEKAVANILTP